MIVDDSTGYIFVSGLTQSANFGPAQNSHGFLYALNGDGNWMWGQFFYNVSYCVSEIIGIQMSSKNSFLTALGYAN